MQTKNNILVLTKNPETATYLKVVLKNEYNITVSDNGKSAIESIASGNKCDGIIASFYLSELGGLELGDELRRLGYNTPIAYLQSTNITASEMSTINDIGAHIIDIGKMTGHDVKEFISELVKGAEPHIKDKLKPHSYPLYF